jgi:hypothetical protein
MSSASSFFSLFKRGHYYRTAALDDSSPGAKQAREDRERFITAALAFCLRHDTTFLRAFWQKICRVPGDPEEMPTICETTSFWSPHTGRICA